MIGRSRESLGFAIAARRCAGGQSRGLSSCGCVGWDDPAGCLAVAGWLATSARLCGRLPLWEKGDRCRDPVTPASRAVDVACGRGVMRGSRRLFYLREGSLLSVFVLVGGAGAYTRAVGR